MEFDGLIFDLDGTLWDAVDIYIEGWNNVFLRKNINFKFERADFEKMVGWNPSDFLKVVLPDYSIQNREIFYQEVNEEHYQLLNENDALIYPGAKRGLKILSENNKTFIVSNCSRGIISKFLNQFEIGSYITDHLSHGDNGMLKSENIRLMVDRHKLKRPVYIGDTDSDSQQSEMAGIPFVWVTYGFGKTNKYIQKAGSFEELVNLFG